MTAPVVIVGGSLAALRTAEALRKAGSTRDVIVLGSERYMPYNRPPLSKGLLSGREEAEALAFPIRDAIADVQWQIGTRVVSLDLAGQAVRTAAGEVVGYGTLIIATGVRARRVSGHQGARERFALRTVEDALALRTKLTPGAHVVILGSGFVGCEVAATARAAGCEVTVITRTAFPMQRVLGDALAGVMRARHEEQGVRFVHSTRPRIDRLHPRVTLEGGPVIAGDVLVEAIGSQPNTDWLDDPLLAAGGTVRTDHGMRVVGVNGEVVPNVYAVGDVAAFPSALDGGRTRAVEHWNMPGEMAKRAAAVICADSAGDLDSALARPFAPVPSFWTDQYDLHMLSYGLPALSDSNELLHGDRNAECVYGYFRDGALVGVCGLGMRSKVLEYRSRIGAAMAAARAA